MHGAAQYVSTQERSLDFNILAAGYVLQLILQAVLLKYSTGNIMF